MNLENAAAPSVPAARTFAAYRAEARYELVRTLRMPAFTIAFVVVPVVLYLFFGAVMPGSHANPQVAYHLFTGFALTGIMGSGMFGFGMSIATEREQGLLTLKRSLPAPPLAFLVAKMCVALVLAVLIMLTMVVTATFNAAGPTVPQSLSVAGVLIPGVLPFCAIGLFIGTRVSAKAAAGFVNLCYLPMIYLSDMLIPLPGSMQAIPQISPAYHLNQLALGAVGMPTQGSMLMHVAVLVVVAVVFTGLAVRRLARVG